MELRMTRQCGDCTACCQGWLPGEAYGRHFFPGKPCHFLECNGCTIYEQRPESPCQHYNCEWLINWTIPAWMKPTVSNAIITQRNWTDSRGGENKYWDVCETGKKITPEALNWLFQYHQGTGMPMVIQVNGGYHAYGTDEFAQSVER